MTQHESFQPRQPGRRQTYDDGYRQAPAQPVFRPAADPGRGRGEPQPGREAERPRGQRRSPDPRRAETDPRRAAPPEGEDLPSWAGLGPDGHPEPSRGDRSATRRQKRRLLMIGSAVVVVAAGVAGYFALGRSTGPANVVSGDLITTFLPGEVQQVPNACEAVPAATLSQYMPGKVNTAAPPLNSGMESQCTWTLDHAPTYRVLELDVHAYSPSGLATGDGSATFAAIDAFAEAEQAKQAPGKRSGEPPAQITTLSHIGNAGFLATQVFHSDGTTTYVVTEVVRYRNVLVTAVVDGLNQTTGSKHYGPVAVGDLTTADEAVAQGATTKVIG